MNILDTEIPYYPGNIKITKPTGKIMVGEMLYSIASPKPAFVELIEKIRTAKNKKIKSELKTKLVFFTPSAVPIKGGGRRYSDISHFTGILPLDFDKLPSVEYAEKFKNALFKEYPFIFGAWLSSSGKGCRFLVKIPIVNTVEEFQQYYAGIEDELGHYKGFDSAPKNAFLPMFYSIDRNLLVRSIPETFTYKKIEVIPPKKTILIPNNSPSKLKAVYTIVANDIDPIASDGHTQLRASAYKVGGYVASNYISEQEAIDLFHSHIEQNAYLSKGTAGYKRTATEMIKKGQNEPIELR